MAERHSVEKLGNACDAEILGAVQRAVEAQGGVARDRDSHAPNSPVGTVCTFEMDHSYIHVAFSASNGLYLSGPHVLVTRVAHCVRASIAA